MLRDRSYDELKKENGGGPLMTSEQAHRDAYVNFRSVPLFRQEQGNRKFYLWSTPKSFAFFAVLIILALLVAELLALFIDPGGR
jgi:hypothetical protein